MIQYDVSEFNIQQISYLNLYKLQLKKQTKTPITPSQDLKIYTNDQIPSIISKVAIETKIQMSDISCVFLQNNHFLVPFNYQLNTLTFQNQSIIDITLNYEINRDQYKEIGPIPFKIQEILFIDRFKDELDLLVPQIQTRQQTLQDLFDISKPIDVYILNYQEIQQELVKFNVMFKSQLYMNYFKYLFKLKYFPYSEDQSLSVGVQFQLKQNYLQDMLINNKQNILKEITFKFIVQSIQLTQQISEGQFDLQMLFDSIHIKEQEYIKYVQYLYILEETQFYAQKSSREELESFKQFYEDVLIIQMQSGAKCEINANGKLTLNFDNVSGDLSLSKNQQSRNLIDDLMIFLNNELQLLLTLIEEKAPQSLNETTKQLSKDQSEIGQKQIQQQLSQQYSIVSRVSVNGIMIKPYQLQTIIAENPEIFTLKEGTEAQIITNLFLNKPSVIRLVDSSRDETTFEIDSICSNYVKMLVPSICIYVLQNKTIQDTSEQNYSSRGYQKLKNNDQFLFDGILPEENYSRLCKKHQQPTPVSDQQKDEKNVSKYYNFTQKRTQYYECPKDYPNLGFIVNKHQKDYCIPCCYNASQTATKKKKLVTQTCLNEHKYSESPQQDSQINTYIFTNPNKLLPFRNTVLHQMIQQLLHPEKKEQEKYAWFVYTLQIPDFTSVQRQKVISLFESCCYVLSIGNEQFMKKLKEFVLQYPQFREQMLFLSQNQDQLINSDQFEFLISQFIDQQYQLNIIYIHDNTYFSKGIQSGSAQIVNFGMQRDSNIILIKKKDIYNPVVLGLCKDDQFILNVDHVSKRLFKTPNTYIPLLKSSIEKEQQQRPHNLQKIIKKLRQSSIFKLTDVNYQIQNTQGYVYYIELTIEYKNRDYLMLLPVTPSIQLQENIDTSFYFSQIQDYNQNEELLELIIESIYHCSPQNQIINHINKQLVGFVFNSLFFYCQKYPNQTYKNLPLHSLINFNPLELNQAIVKQEFTKIPVQTLSASLKFAYFSNIYKLMKLQYAYQNNYSPNQLKSWDTIFVFKDINEIYKSIEQLSKQAIQQIQELIKMKACFIQDEKQFFCEGNRLVIPTQFKPYIELLKNDVQRDLSIRYQQVYQIMLQQFVFQDKEGDHLQTGVAKK